ncbi:MAG: putative sugar nucleotidyl transferase [Rhodothermales bacterium]
MTHLCIFEDDQVEHLRPLVDLRAVYQLRPGIRTLLEAIRTLLPSCPLVLHARKDVASIAATATGWPAGPPPGEVAVVFVNGRLIAEEGPVLERIKTLFAPEAGEQTLVQDGVLVAAKQRRVDARLFECPAIGLDAFPGARAYPVDGARFVRRHWHVIDEIRAALVRDAAVCARDTQTWHPLPETLAEGVVAAGRENILVADPVRIMPGVILNATNGPIVIDEHATIMEGSILRGPLYIGPRSTVKALAELEGCSIGPGCKVGGEVQDVILHAHANKGHAGFLGHSYIGKWCNLGAGTTVSNLRNDYGEVSLYNMHLGRYEPSGRQFLGVIMADHTKTGIQSMINTGSVFGVSCNLFGAGYMDRYAPSFSWGGPERGFVPYRIDKALRVAEMVMARRSLDMTEDERMRLIALYRSEHPQLIDAPAPG